MNWGEGFTSYSVVKRDSIMEELQGKKTEPEVNSLIVYILTRSQLFVYFLFQGMVLPFITWSSESNVLFVWVRQQKQLQVRSPKNIELVHTKS